MPYIMRCRGKGRLTAMENNKTCAVLGKGIFEMGYGLDEKYYKYSELRLNMVITLSELFTKGYNKFISNAEWGFALWACEFIIKMRKLSMAQLYIVAPFEEQAKKWTNEARERYYNVNDQCDEAAFLRQGFIKGCYIECDKKIIDECDLLFTDKEHGFAAKYARDNGKHVITCDNSSLILL